jgi:hypothetical protein
MGAGMTIKPRVAQHGRPPKSLREERRSRLRKILALMDEGLSRNEIAPMIDVTPKALDRIIRSAGLNRMGHRGRRRLTTYLRETAIKSLRALADRSQITPREMAERILHVATEEDGRIAMKILGKDALPKKQVQRYPRGKGSASSC